MKQCAICKEHKQFDQFQKGKNGKCHSYCKPCYSVWSHQNYLKKRDRRLAKQRENRLLNGDKVREQERRSKQKHKEAVNIRSREWARRNPEKRLQYHRTWAAKNKEAIVEISHRHRAKIREARIGLVTKNDLRAILRRPCIYCGAKAEHIDHVIPLARGGSHSIGNLAPSCKRCNQTKKALFVIEWRRKKGDFSHYLRS